MEVFESDAETINVGAFFVDEGLMRSVHVTFPITAPTAAVTRSRGGLDDEHDRPRTRRSR